MDIKFVGRTIPAGVTQEEGHTGFLIHLLSAVRAMIFLARRIQPFLSLVDRENEFCVLTISSFSTRLASILRVILHQDRTRRIMDYSMVYSSLSFPPDTCTITINTS